MNPVQSLNPEREQNAQSSLRELSYLALHLEVVLERNWNEPLPGFAWRSLIGLVARRYFPEIFKALFDETSAQSRLWSFCVTQPEPGPVVLLQVNLFGIAAAWGMEISKIVQMGAVHGVGRSRSRYSLSSGWFVAGDNNPVQFMHGGVFKLWPMGRAISLDCSIRPKYFEFGPSRMGDLRVCWLTPVLLKFQGSYLRDAPDLRLLLDRIATRINHVSQAVLGCEMLVDPLRGQLQTLASQCELIDSKLWLESLSRKSSRTGQVMRVDGLIGSVHYRGPVLPMLEVLRWAKRLQLGSKTGLGCGAFEYTITSADPN